MVAARLGRHKARRHFVLFGRYEMFNAIEKRAGLDRGSNCISRPAASDA
jgi:hypothetical protein